MTIETQADVEALKTIGKIVAETLKLMMSEAKVGMTTKELDEIGKNYLELHHAKSAPKYCYNRKSVSKLQKNHLVTIPSQNPKPIFSNWPMFRSKYFYPRFKTPFFLSYSFFLGVECLVGTKLSIHLLCGGFP